MSLHLLLGPMYAGKSSEALRLANLHRARGRRVLFVNHAKDTRSGRNRAMTHDGAVEEARSVETLQEVGDEELDGFDAVVVEEAQWFADLVPWTLRAFEELNKHVIVVSLDGDYLRRPFGHALELVCRATAVEKKLALCEYCAEDTPAPFTRRIVPDDRRDVVGARELYRAVCWKHHRAESIDVSPSVVAHA
ncbi:Thymidine kinase [uncultured virus]|nr:Thymidine kinase [uncultured virus]